MPALTREHDTPRLDLGAGLYALADLRAYVAIHGDPADSKRVLPWLTNVLHPVQHTPKRPDYSFSDLISLFVVRIFLKKGVRLREIREAEGYLRDLWQTDRPFVRENFQTDGTDVFYGGQKITGQIEAANKRGQQTMLEMVRTQLVDVCYSDETAATWLPMEGIRVDPKIQFGDPVVDGTRVQTSLVTASADALGEDEAAERFDISLEAVHRAMIFERRKREALTP